MMENSFPRNPSITLKFSTIFPIMPQSLHFRTRYILEIAIFSQSLYVCSRNIATVALFIVVARKIRTHIDHIRSANVAF